ncbi:MAG: autotransporter-associated beta strand repeat-containing protein [Pirellulales bacterium]
MKRTEYKYYCFSSVLFCAAVTCQVCHASPARLWFSLSSYDPYRYSYSESQPNLQVPQIEMLPGQDRTLYLWAQPQTMDRSANYSPQNPFRQLTNLSLQVDASGTSAAATAASFTNPVNSGHPRFDKLIDSNNPATFTVGLSEVTLPALDNGDLKGLLAFPYDIYPASGIGPGCVAGTCIAANGNSAWLLGTVKVHANAVGPTDLRLQIGNAGMTHANENVPTGPNDATTTHVLFGADTLAAFEYNAAYDRQLTLSGDSPDAIISVVTTLPGDFDGSGAVDAADFVKWRKNASTLGGAAGFATWRATFNHSVLPPVPNDYNLNGTVDAADFILWRNAQGNAADYNAWRNSFASTRAQSGTASGVTAVPEPRSMFLALLGALVIAVHQRPRRHLGTRRIAQAQNHAIGARIREAPLPPKTRDNIDILHVQQLDSPNGDGRTRFVPPTGSLTTFHGRQVIGRLLRLFNFVAFARRAPLTIVAPILLLVLSVPTTGFAQYFWDGGGSNDAWDTRQNWDIDNDNNHGTGDDPVSVVFSNSNAPVVVFNAGDLNSGSSSFDSFLGGQRFVQEIQFVSAGTVNITAGGGSLVLKAGGITTGSGTNGTMTINAPTETRANQSWNIGRNLVKKNQLDLNTFTLTVTGSGTTSIEGAIIGSGMLIKGGTGELDLSGNNSYSGGTRLNNGLTVINSGTSFGTGYVEFNGGNLQFDGNVGVTNELRVNAPTSISTHGHNGDLTGTVIGSQPLTKNGTGKLNFTGNTSGYTGTMTVNDGTLEVFVSSLPNSVIVNNSAHISLNGDGTYGGVVSGGIIDKYGSGNVHLSNGGINYSTMNVVFGTLSGYAGSLKNQINLSAGTAVYFQQETGSNFFGTVDGSGALYKQGAGEVDLTSSTSSNDYSGGTFLQGGRLVVNDSSQLGTGTIHLSGGGLRAKGGFDLNRQLDLGSGGVFDTGPYTVSVSNATIGGGTLTKDGSGFLQLLSQNNSAFGIVVNGGGVQGTTQAIRGPLSIAGGAQVNFNQGPSSPSDFNSTISGGGLVSVTGGGRVNLNAASPSWSGGLSLTNSTVSANGTTLGSGTITLHGGWLDINGTAPIGNPIYLSANSAISPGVSVTMGGKFSGPGGFDKQNGGTLTLTGSNDYVGGTTFSGGVVVAGISNLGTGNLAFNGGTLRLADASTINRPITLNAGGGTIDTNSLNPTISGAIGGAGTFSKTGWGTLLLTGPNSYTGGTQISLHYLQGNTNSIKGNISFSTNGLSKGVIFDHATGFVGGFGNTISGEGGVTKIGDGTLALTGANNYSVGTTISGGTLAILSDSNLGQVSAPLALSGGVLRTDAGVTIARQVELNFSASSIDTIGFNSTITGKITGSGRLVKYGTGVLNLRGATNDYSGGTLIDAGTLSVTSDANLGASSGAVELRGGTLRTDAAISGTHPISLVFSGGSINTNGFDSTWNGLISGSGTLTKTGGGSLTLPGVNTYTGGTSITGGRLSVNGSVTGPTFVDTGATLGGNGTIGGSVTGPGHVAPGNSPGILTINGNYTQDAASELEIEIAKGTLPVTPGVDHDQLRVGGTAKLLGNLNFVMYNGYIPSAGDRVRFLDTFGAGTVDLTVEPNKISTPGLKALNDADLDESNDLAVRVIADTHWVDAEYTLRKNISFADQAHDTAQWVVGGSWNSGMKPKSDDGTIVSNQRQFQVNNRPQRVELTTGGTEAVADLLVQDNTAPITVGITAGSTINVVTGDAVIGSKGAIELNTGALIVNPTQKVSVSGSGMLSGTGAVTGAVEVGIAGGSHAMLSPGINPTGSSVGVGTLSVTGNYTQGAGGVYKVDITGDNSGLNNDKIQVTGNIELGNAPATRGTLVVDLTGANAGLTLGAPYTIATATGTTNGEFGDIQVVGRPDLYARVIYGAPAAGAGVQAGLANGSSLGLATNVVVGDMGDATHDTFVDADDAAVFAAVLLNPKVSMVTGPSAEGPGKTFRTSGSFLNVFDFMDTRSAVDGDEDVKTGARVIDFFDRAGFVQAMLDHPRPGHSVSLGEAQEILRRALKNAETAAIPEPSSCAFLAVAVILTVFRRNRTCLA